MADLQTVDSPSVVWATAEHSSCTRHRQYHLTCAEFDALLERAAGHCEICGTESQPQIKGLCLHIDHEHFIGKWAVRGLLCYVCNQSLQSNRRIPPDPRIKRYIDNTWYVHELNRRGLSQERPPEPPVGSVVFTGELFTTGKRWERYTDRRDGCWVVRSQNRYVSKTWRELWYQYGPLHLTIKQVGGDVCSYLLKELKTQARYLLEDDAPARVAASPAVLDERIARVRAVLASARWLKGDLKYVAEIEGILTGRGRPTIPQPIPLPASEPPGEGRLF